MMKDALPTFAALLQHYRALAGLTQEELAERAHLSTRGISDLERGVRHLPRPDTVRRLAAALQLSAEQRTAFEQAARPLPMPRTVTPTAATRHAPLPIPPTPLLGRDQDVAQVIALLQRAGVRLVTLTGTGGVGKTRVALQVAAELQATFTDGVVWIALASLRDPALVLPTIAHMLGVTITGGEPVEERLNAYLRDQHLVLVLDNLEQVLPVAPRIAALLAHAPHLKILATSRAPLHVAGEHEVPVPPLAQSPAVALFMARAQAVKPSFTLTDENERAIGALCARLDGLPLAIELAASRIKLLPPQALLARLDERLSLLRGGAVDGDPKHYTLRATLDWSYHLLTPHEQKLFAWLGVFVDGWTIAAAEAVCHGAGDAWRSVVEDLHTLLDHNLLYTTDGVNGEPRVGMLETIGEYARARLVESEEADAIQRAHADYYVAFAEQAEPKLTGPQQTQWLNHLEQEHANLRAVLEWATERGDADLALRLGAALGPFWNIHGHFAEGRQWLHAALAQGTAQPAALRAKVLAAAGKLAQNQSDHDAARTLLDESLVLSRRVADTATSAAALTTLGKMARNQDDYPQAIALAEESLGLYRALNDTSGIADALNVLACVALDQGEPDYAAPLLEESLVLRRQVGDLRGNAAALNNLGMVAQARGDDARAADLFRESLVLRRQLGDTWGSAVALNNLGLIAREQGDAARAVALYEESLALARNLRDTIGISQALDNLGLAALDQGDALRATTLFQESLALAQQVGAVRGSAEVLNHLARAAQAQGDTTRALNVFQESLARAWSLRYKLGIAMNLEGIGELATVQGHAARAARLLGAAAGLRAASGTPLQPSDRAGYDRLLATVRSQVDSDVFAAAWDEGQCMSMEQVVAYACAGM